MQAKIASKPSINEHLCTSQSAAVGSADVHFAAAQVLE